MAPSTIDTPAYGGRATIHFNVAKHYYTVSVPELGKLKVYQPGVTSIIGMKDKSGPLCWWTAEQCEAFMNQEINSLLSQFHQDSLPGSVTIEWLRQRLPMMKKNYRTVKQEAAEVGSMAHDYAHAFLMWREFGGDSPKRPEFDPVSPISQEQIDQANKAIDAVLKFYEEHHVKPLTLESPVWSPSRGFIGTDDFIGMIDGEKVVADYKTSKRIYPEVWLQTAAYQFAYQEEHPKEKIDARVAINIGKDGSLDVQRRPNDRFFAADLMAFTALREIYLWDRVHGYDAKGDIEIIGALPAPRKSRKAAVLA